MTMASPSDFKVEVAGFEKYIAETTKTPSGLISFFTVFVAASIVLTIPILCWRDRRKQRLHNASEHDQQGGEGGGQQEMVSIPNQEQSTSFSVDQSAPITPGEHIYSGKETVSQNGLQNRVMEEENNGHGIASSPTQQQAPFSSSDPHPRVDGDDHLSATPSAASTSRIRTGGDGIVNTGTIPRRRRSGRPWELAASRRPWGHSRPVGRADFVRTSLEAERQSQASEEGSQASRRSRTSWVSARAGHRSHVRQVSDAASSILSGEIIEGEAEFYRNRYVRRSRFRPRRPPSESDASLMPPLSPDALSPEDAADAHDTGRVNRPEDFEPAELPPYLRSGPLRAIISCFDTVLDLADHDYEAQRILSLAIPSTIGAVADPLFRLVLLAIISYFVHDTDSMAAYVLVVLFLRLTSEEISGAVTDVESNLVKEALAQGGDTGFLEAGQCVQRAIAMQILVGAPLLLVWTLVMGDVVLWFLKDDNIHDDGMAGIAGEYANVIIVDYILRGITRAFMLPFHLNGQAQFERNIDVMAALLTIVAIVTVAAMIGRDGEPSLFYIGCIQVIIGIAATIIKVTYVALKGWLQPYQRGLVGSIALVSVSTSLHLYTQREWTFLTPHFNLRTLDPFVRFSWRSCPSLSGRFWSLER